MQAVWWLWFGYFCFCRFAQRKFPPWIEPNVNAQFEWQFRHLRTSIYYYLDCKLQMINLTSELPVNACMVCMVYVCTWQSHCSTSIDWSFIYLCKLIACCSTGVCTLNAHLIFNAIAYFALLHFTAAVPICASARTQFTIHFFSPLDWSFQVIFFSIFAQSFSFAFVFFLHSSFDVDLVCFKSRLIAMINLLLLLFACHNHCGQ